jgi:probable rRNA maturation factor
MYKIYVFNETTKLLKKETKIIRKVLKKLFKKEKIKRNIEINIVFVDDEKICALNKEYRNIDKPTDVLSFALLDKTSDEIEIKNFEFNTLGDIYISVDRAKEQALLYGHSFLREIVFLAVHGTLHLLGYSHENKEKEKIMFSKQEEILNECGIKR